MANSPFDANPAFAKMSEDARHTVTQAFDSMSNWRSQMSDMSEKNSEAVFNKMAEAAKALGWPPEFVEMSRKQVQTATKMQTQMVDQVMETWQQQMTAPGSPIKMPSFSAPAFQMPTFPGFPTATGNGAFPGFGDASANPMQMWAQAAEMWQKNWQQALGSWMDAQSNVTNMMTPGGTAKKTTQR